MACLQGLPKMKNIIGLLFSGICFYYFFFLNRVRQCRITNPRLNVRVNSVAENLIDFNIPESSSPV